MHVLEPRSSSRRERNEMANGEERERERSEWTKYVTKRREAIAWIKKKWAATHHGRKEKRLEVHVSRELRARILLTL